MALQTDVFSRPAEVICGLLRRIAPPGEAAGLLAGWDHRLGAASAPAALFEVWWMAHLRPALLARFAPDPAVRQLLLPGDGERMLALLTRPAPHWTAAERDTMLLATLASGYAECEARLGADPALWQWGALHHAQFDHAASRIGGTGWDVGPLPLGGSRSTPMNATYRMGDYRLTSGASVRLVMDVGGWDNSVCINAPGQSGDPRSAHYADLSGPWSEGAYVPLLYSRARVCEATETLIHLLPEQGTA